MARHSFIQMSKLSMSREEYRILQATQDRKTSTPPIAPQTMPLEQPRKGKSAEFKRSGTTGKCIEARELIIALPELYTKFDPDKVLKDFTDLFRKRYGVECVSALHHNKRKTNYHIHLIFSERKLLPEPDIKIATRSVFFNEAGQSSHQERNHRGGRTDTKRLYGHQKGEIYESHLFTTKDERFKKRNLHSRSKGSIHGAYQFPHFRPRTAAQSFDTNGVYLPTKKIGKNNPKEEEIKADNAARQSGTKRRIWH